MDGRRSLVVVLGFLIIMSGCTYPIAGLRVPSASNEMVHKAPTYVAFGDFRAASGFAKDMPQEMKQQLREDARLSYLKAIEVDPQYLPAYLALARLQQRCENFADAIATYQKAIALNAEDHALWYELAMCQCRQKNWNDGIASLQKALELSPNNQAYLVTLGYTLGRAGRLAESLSLLSQVQGEGRALYDLARLLKHMNQEGLARQYAAMALQRDPKLPGLQQFAAELQNHPGGPISTVAYQSPATTPPETATQPGVPTSEGASAGNATPHQTSGTPTATPEAKSTNRPIRLPPLPVVSIPSSGE